MRFHNRRLPIMCLCFGLVMTFSCKPRKTSELRSQGNSCGGVVDEVRKGPDAEKVEKFLTLEVIATASSDKSLRSEADSTLSDASFRIETDPTRSSGAKIVELAGSLDKQEKAVIVESSLSFLSAIVGDFSGKDPAEIKSVQARQVDLIQNGVFPLALQSSDPKLAGQVVATLIDTNAALEVKAGGDVSASTKGILSSFSSNPKMNTLFVNPAVSQPVKSVIYSSIVTVGIATGANLGNEALRYSSGMAQDVTKQLDSIARVRGALAHTPDLRSALLEAQRKGADQKVLDAIILRAKNSPDRLQSAPDAIVVNAARDLKLNIPAVEPSIVHMKTKIRIPTP